MPLITLQYTENLKNCSDFPALFQSINQVVSDLAVTDIQNCQSRAIPLKDFLRGNSPEKGAFINLEIALIIGRTDEVKQQIAETLISAIKKHFAVSESALDVGVFLVFTELEKGNLYR